MNRRGDPLKREMAYRVVRRKSEKRALIAETALLLLGVVLTVMVLGLQGVG